MEHVGSLTDYEKLKKAEMAVVSVWPYVQKLMQLENEVSQKDNETGFVEKFMRVEGVYDAALISHQGDIVS